MSPVLVLSYISGAATVSDATSAPLTYNRFNPVPGSNVPATCTHSPTGNCDGESRSSVVAPSCPVKKLSTLVSPLGEMLSAYVPKGSVLSLSNDFLRIEAHSAWSPFNL